MRYIVRTTVALLVAIGLLVACSDDSNDAKDDAKVTSCKGGGGDRPTAAGEVVNHSSKTSSYVLRVTFYDSDGNRVSEGGDSLKSVDPDEKATWKTSGVARANGDVTCKITNVERVATPG